MFLLELKHMATGQHWLFFTRYLKHPKLMGSIAPSSQALAEAVCEPYRKSVKRVRVLEVGAGTGAITRYLGSILKPGDELDVCEIQPSFRKTLEEDVFTLPAIQPAVREGRIRLFMMPVQKLPVDRKYDYIVCGLPLTIFKPEDIREVFAYFRRSLNPGGVFSYYEYVGLRRTSRALALGRERDRIREVHGFLSENIRHHQFSRRTVLNNFPPAHARHLHLDVDYAQDRRNGRARRNGRVRHVTTTG